MDAFLHFLIELALWNLLLATLAFLCGLLMGYWLWGQFKKKLAESARALHASENEFAALAERHRELRETNRELSANSDADQDKLKTELAASRAALAEKKKELAERETAEEKVQAKEEELTQELEQLKEEQRALEAARDEALSAKKAAEEKEAEYAVQDEKQGEKLAALEKKLTKEKAEGASLREVTAELNSSEKGLKAKVGKLEEELAEKVAAATAASDEAEGED